MERVTKILSFVLVCVFCLSALSIGVFAKNSESVMPMAYTPCPDHPNAELGVVWTQTATGILIHRYICSTCGLDLGYDKCSFTGYGDCTTYSYCLICDRPNPVQYSTHDFSGEWKGYASMSYHYKTCTRTNCFEEYHEAHNKDWTITVDGTTYKQCSVCHAVFKN